MLDDLEISQRQREQLKELMPQLGERARLVFDEYHRLNAEERQKRVAAQVRSGREAIKEILLPQQFDRLQQIALQLQGLRAFEDPDVVARLKLTNDQRQRLRMVAAEPLFDRPDRPDGGRPKGPGPGPGGLRKGPPPHEMAANKGPGGTGKGRGSNPDNGASGEMGTSKALGVLTEEQLAIWREMVGRPFTGDGPHHGNPFGSPRQRFNRS